MKGKTAKITYTAIFMALVIVGTIIHITPSAHSGYTHFGDSMIYLASCILPAPYALLASSAGAALADILTGSANWAIPTLIIKALNALPFILIRIYLKKKNKDDKIISVYTILMLIPTSLITIFGYLVAELIMYGTKFAFLSAFTTGWLQPTGSLIVFIIVGLALDKLNFKVKVQKAIGEK